MSYNFTRRFRIPVRHFPQINANQPNPAGDSFIPYITDKFSYQFNLCSRHSRYSVLWTTFEIIQKWRQFPPRSPGGGIFEEHWSVALSGAGRRIHFLCTTFALFVPSSLTCFHQLLIFGVKLRSKLNYTELAKSLMCQSKTGIELVPFSMHNLIACIMTYTVYYRNNILS